MLVLLGATPEGKKELIGFQVGVRESGDVLNLLGNEWGASFAVRFENRA